MKGPVFVFIFFGNIPCVVVDAEHSFQTFEMIIVNGLRPVHLMLLSNSKVIGKFL